MSAVITSLPCLASIVPVIRIDSVIAVRGKRHDYLAMVLDFSISGVLKVDMTNYVKSMVEEFPEKLSGNTNCPWNENLFKVDDTSILTNEKIRRSLLDPCGLISNHQHARSRFVDYRLPFDWQRKDHTDSL